MNNQGYYCGHCGGTEFGGAKGGDCQTCGKDDKQVPWGGWSLGKRLAMLREDAGMSQELLAEQAGVSRNWVSMFELDKGNPTQETLRKVFGALGYDVELRIARKRNVR